MRVVLLTVFVLTVVTPLYSRPIAEDEFDNDDPDENEYSEFSDNSPKQQSDQYYVDEEFAAAKRAYEELQSEIKKMQETLNELRNYETTDFGQQLDNKENILDTQDLTQQEDSNQDYEEDQSKSNSLPEIEIGNFQQNTKHYNSNDDDDDGNDALAEDAVQNAAQGVIENEEDEDEDEDNTKEEIDVLHRDEGNEEEEGRDGYHEEEVQDNLNDDSREGQTEDDVDEDDY